MSKLINSLKIIREELLVKDEPIKAYNLLKLFNKPELKPELDRTYGLIRHIMEPAIYKKYYGMHGEDQIPDCELIEPREFITNAGARYERYKWIVDEFEMNRPKSYLDLACYIGSLVTTAASKGIKAYGVDMTKRAIEVARERAKFANLECEFFCDDVTKFNGVRADMVSAFEVLEHVPDPKEFIEHLCSLSNGWVYITTPNGSYGDGEGNLGHWDWDGEELHVRGHVRVFTKASLFKLLSDCGCEIDFLDAMQDNLLWAKFKKGGKNGMV
jgi:hypothetical protein